MLKEMTEKFGNKIKSALYKGRIDPEATTWEQLKAKLNGQKINPTLSELELGILDYLNSFPQSSGGIAERIADDEERTPGYVQDVIRRMVLRGLITKENGGYSLTDRGLSLLQNPNITIKKYRYWDGLPDESVVEYALNEYPFTSRYKLYKEDPGLYKELHKRKLLDKIPTKSEVKLAILIAQFMYLEKLK